MTTDPPESSVPVWLQDDDVVGQHRVGRVDLVDATVVAYDEPPRVQLVRLGDDVQQHRHPDTDEHCELQRDHQREDEGDAHDYRWHRAGLVDAQDVVGLDRLDSDDDQEASEGRHRDVPNRRRR
jgi:hypothetical protein